MTARTQPTHPTDWRMVAAVTALAISASALVFAGGMIIGFGATCLGKAMIAVGFGFLVVASAVQEVD
jgi:hypothetical protein